MSATPHVAVILPVYNRAQTVFDTLVSVARQTLPPSEFFIIDDGSTDALHETIDRWKYEFCPTCAVRVHRQANQGAAAARNVGIAAAPDAKYFAFIDSDDQWPADFLERTVAAMKGNPNAIAASTDQTIVNAETGQSRLKQLKFLARNPARWMIEYGAGVGCATLFRADVVRSFGGFPAHIPTGHDAHLLLRIALCGQWLHCKGEPAIIGESVAAVRGEFTHVRHRYPNHKEIWAMVYEDFVENAGGRDALLDVFCDRQLARKWVEAGTQLAKIGRHDQARRCFARALKYRRRLKTVVRLARSGLIDFIRNSSREQVPMLSVGSHCR